jgi:hypothetical protein
LVPTRRPYCLTIRDAPDFELLTSAYAPDLNPDEGIWNYLKRVELGNRCCGDLTELAVALRRAKERLRHKRTVIQACFRQAGYQVLVFMQKPSRTAVTFIGACLTV